MSQIKANDLTNTTGGIPTVKGQKLIPTAWVNFNGTGTVAIRDSENVSSITDGGVGIYYVNFVTDMSNASYCVTGMHNKNSGHKSSIQLQELLAASCKFSCYSGGNAFVDPEIVTITSLGGQA
jgi:hypothetical protein